MNRKFIASFGVLALSLNFFSTTAFAGNNADQAVLILNTNSTYSTQLQNKLGKLGYFNRSSTGFYGSIMADALERYQASKESSNGAKLFSKNISENIKDITEDKVVVSRGEIDRTASTVAALSQKEAARLRKIDNILEFAKRYIGVPYVWGGESPSGFDCSGFTKYVFGKNGITLPRTASQQYGVGTSVKKSELQPGDLVFFTTYKPGPSHLGIYMGNNKFIHASTSKGVTITELSNSYYAPRYIGARRVVK